MPASDWYPSDVDPQGFVSIHALRKRARALDRESFAAAYPRPALIAEIDDDDIAFAAREPSGEVGVQLLTVAYSRPGILRFLDRVAFVCKRPGNPYAHLVAIGRSRKNDIVLDLESVSKVHATIVREGDRWAFTDRHSTNGSWLGERRLEPGARVALGDRDRLRLGLDATLRFLLPDSLFDYVRGL